MSSNSQLPADDPSHEHRPRVRRLPDDSPAADVTHEGEGLSLDKLSQAFSRLLGKSSDDATMAESAVETGGSTAEGQLASDDGTESDKSSRETMLAHHPSYLDDDEEDQIVSPNEIVEAILFVGHPEGEPISARYIASLMCGVSPQEVDQLVAVLQEEYSAQSCPYSIESVGTSYRMILREQFSTVRERFYSRIRQARLSQTAIDVLALVAYNQPITRAEVDELCGRTCSAILSQLVRRELLSLKTCEENQKSRRYSTTDRFLQFFGLETLADLPRSQEMDRS